MNIAKFCKVTYFEEHMPAPAFAFCQKLHYQIILNLQKQLPEGVPQKSYFWKLCKIHRKTPVWVSPLKKIQSVGLTAWRVSKYRVISGPYFAVFGLNTEIYFANLRNQSDAEKYGHFSGSVCNFIKKRYSETGVFLQILQKFREQLFDWTGLDHCFWIYIHTSDIFFRHVMIKDYKNCS